MKQLFDKHFEVFMLLVIWLFLLMAHSFMVHAKRPVEMIQWAERDIDQVFIAAIAWLAGKSSTSMQGEGKENAAKQTTEPR